MGMNALVVGSGGREHALAWALRCSPQVDQVYAAPGNAGTATNVPIASDDIPGLLAFARENHVDLTVVGPEAPLANGIVDVFLANGLRIFGPTREAARLESSKAFAKAFMAEHGIPTAPYHVFADYESALDFVMTFDGTLVVKADGLAAGKGVVVCDTKEAARAALWRIMIAREFGGAGDSVVIEERLTGREASVLAFSDGRAVALMPPARDYKRVYDGDTGPNTGGMGAFAPAPDVTPEIEDEVRHAILQPVIDGMAARGAPYVGVLYAGLMLTAEGPKVLEFNCRFGDPETQVILPLLESDLAEILLACVECRLNEIDVKWRAGACATVVLASPGYPGSYAKGLPISGVEQIADRDILIFHAGTACEDGRLVTSGGRVLAVSGLGGDLPAALERAYAGVARIHFEGMHYRRDIGLVR